MRRRREGGRCTTLPLLLVLEYPCRRLPSTCKTGLDTAARRLERPRGCCIRTGRAAPNRPRAQVFQEGGFCRALAASGT